MRLVSLTLGDATGDACRSLPDDLISVVLFVCSGCIHIISPAFIFEVFWSPFI